MQYPAAATGGTLCRDGGRVLGQVVDATGASGFRRRAAPISVTGHPAAGGRHPAWSARRVLLEVAELAYVARQILRQGYVRENPCSGKSEKNRPSCSPRHHVPPGAGACAVKPRRHCNLSG
ncbi:hypothetical protein ACQPXS_09090 [Streptomyces sp. CA-142005]|uniref:hypothetical protein n=1 Tax=Streptomyces sp. CA-142005 TaxID=3240052 RepID=UPI003D90712B